MPATLDYLDATPNQIAQFIREYTSNWNSKISQIEWRDELGTHIILHFTDRIEAGSAWWLTLHIHETKDGTVVVRDLDTDEIERVHSNHPIGAIYGYNENLNRLYARVVERFRKKIRRRRALNKEAEIIKTFKAMEKRNQKQFGDAFYNDDIKRHKVTAQDVYDEIGGKIGVGKRRIQQVLRDYKTKNRK